MADNNVPIVSKVPSVVTALRVCNFVTMKTGDALRCPPIVTMFIEEAEAYGINWAALFCQAIVETGWFSSPIYKSKGNLFGLGAVDHDPSNQAISFESERPAVRAGVQHMAMFAGLDKIKTLPSEGFVLHTTRELSGQGYFGVVKNFDQLGGKSKDITKWASDPLYGQKIVSLYQQLLEFCAKEALGRPDLLPPILEKKSEELPIPPTPTPLEIHKETHSVLMAPEQFVSKTKRQIQFWIAVVGSILAVASIAIPPPVYAILQMVLRFLKHFLENM